METEENLTNDEIQERKHFQKVVSAFHNYKRDNLERFRRTEENIENMPDFHKNILCNQGYLEHLKDLKNCVERNYEIIKILIKDASRIFLNDLKPDQEPLNGQTLVEDADRVKTTLKQFVRDWSSCGAKERDMCYGRILKEIENIYPNTKSRSNIKVLVPGAGLGRLAFDIALRGFECQGNEISLYMLMASHFILNNTSDVNCFKIHPWIHQTTNNKRMSDVLESVCFPDVNPNDLPSNSKFSMAAGDFLEIYSDLKDEDKFDCVVTCYFIDCSRNIVEFVRVIHKILKPGGKWINFGPLLYHFADMETEKSIEPSYDVVKGIIKEVGFSIDQDEENITSNYMQRESSMLQYVYKCVFFTCTK